MKKLHPNAIALFYLTGVIGWFFFFFFMFIMSSIVFIPLLAVGSMGFDFIGIVFLVLFAGIVWSLLVPWAFAYWSYQNFKYELQKENIYIEKGIIWKKYVSIPYSKVQNVDILRGPLARMLGLSDVQIQTAGGSTQLMIEGRIPGIGVEEAKQLREEILVNVARK